MEIRDDLIENISGVARDAGRSDDAVVVIIKSNGKFSAATTNARFGLRVRPEDVTDDADTMEAALEALAARIVRRAVEDVAAADSTLAKRSAAVAALKQAAEAQAAAAAVAREVAVKTARAALAEVEAKK